jgi:hypothetical protein
VRVVAFKTTTIVEVSGGIAQRAPLAVLTLSLLAGSGPTGALRSRFPVLVGFGAVVF